MAPSLFENICCLTLLRDVSFDHIAVHSKETPVKSALKIRKRREDAAARALAEAAARRDAATDEQTPVELGGRDGPEPTRFGDWENKGLTSDF